MAGLIDALAPHTTIGLDTSPFIYLFEQNPRYLALVETLFTHLKRPDVQGVTSVISLIETCVEPQRQGELALVQTYERALLNSQQVDTLPITPALAKRSIPLRIQYRLRVPDALQVAAALERNATLFITNDRQIRRVTEVSVLLPDDFVS